MPHITVLKRQAVDYLNLKGGVVVDATIGSAGHSLEICKRNKKVEIIGLDRDKDALRRSQETLENMNCPFVLKEANFKNLKTVLEGLGLKKVQGFLFDLGLNSEQLENSGRGFSFQKDEPLLMTFKETPEEDDFTAKEILNEWSEEAIANIIFAYGEEKFARRIAREIVKERKEKSFETTEQLVETIRRAVPRNYLSGKKHFATKTFQGLRIAVNDELEALKKALEDAFLMLDSSGRMVVISFHGLEDKIVKEFFKEKAKEGTGQIITKKLIVPERTEIIENPRSRSAKMRVIEKI